MLRFLVDEDLNGAIVRELRRKLPEIDLTRVQDVGRSGRSDPANLAFAAEEGRILLTHDKRLVRFVRERLRAGQRMPGVVIVHQEAPFGQVIQDLMDLSLLSLDGEWEARVLFVPLR